MTIPPDVLARAAGQRQHVEPLLEAVAELLDAHAFGERAMAARERLAKYARRLGVYPVRRVIRGGKPNALPR